MPTLKESRDRNEAKTEELFGSTDIRQNPKTSGVQRVIRLWTMMENRRSPRRPSLAPPTLGCGRKRPEADMLARPSRMLNGRALMPASGAVGAYLFSTSPIRPAAALDRIETLAGKPLHELLRIHCLLEAIASVFFLGTRGAQPIVCWGSCSTNGPEPRKGTL